MPRASVAFAERLHKILRAIPVLGSAPSDERLTGQTMPKATKSSEAANRPDAPAGTSETSPAVSAAPAKRARRSKAAKQPSEAAPRASKAVKTANAAKTAKSSKPPRPTKSGASATKVTKQAALVSTPETALAPDDGPGAEKESAEQESDGAEFLVEQRVLLMEVRASYTRQADELKAEADSLALEHEPGDVQFDEEGGEGGTSNVDRELDLVLSAQARGAVAEIDRALVKVDLGTYGVCEQCGQPIPHARLKALPYAALCVACKSGGLSRR